MPQVDVNLRPIVVAAISSEPTPIFEAQTPVIPVDHRDRLRSLALSYAVSLNLSMMSLAQRIREYLKVNLPLNDLSEAQLRTLTTFFKQELDILMASRELSREYYSTDNGKRVGFTLETVQRLACNVCGRGFPIEGGPWSPGAVPYIAGGLMFMIDEKGAAQLYHGYEGQTQSCYEKAISAFTKSRYK